MAPSVFNDFGVPMVAKFFNKKNNNLKYQTDIITFQRQKNVTLVTDVHFFCIQVLVINPFWMITVYSYIKIP